MTNYIISATINMSFLKPRGLDKKVHVTAAGEDIKSVIADGNFSNNGLNGESNIRRFLNISNFSGITVQ